MLWFYIKTGMMSSVSSNYYCEKKRLHGRWMNADLRHVYLIDDLLEMNALQGK